MLLSELVGKPVFSSKKIRGVCRGVGLSVKSRAVRYLVCSAPSPSDYTEFFLPVVSVTDCNEEGIFVKKFRSVAPQNCAKFFCGRPVYADTGAYLGITADLEMQDFCALRFFTDSGKSYSAMAIAALLDAVIVKKTPVFPLGQPVPRAFSFLRNVKKTPTVTKSTLKSAIEEGVLIQLTLQLPLFRKSALS